MRLEIKPTPSLITFGGAVAFLVIREQIGIVPSVLFALASASLFISFAIIPYMFTIKDANLKNIHRLQGYYQIDKRKLNNEYLGYVYDCWRLAAILYIVGIIAVVWLRVS